MSTHEGSLSSIATQINHTGKELVNAMSAAQALRNVRSGTTSIERVPLRQSKVSRRINGLPHFPLPDRFLRILYYSDINILGDFIEHAIDIYNMRKQAFLSDDEANGDCEPGEDAEPIDYKIFDCDAEPDTWDYEEPADFKSLSQDARHLTRYFYHQSVSLNLLEEACDLTFEVGP